MTRYQITERQGIAAGLAFAGLALVSTSLYHTDAPAARATPANPIAASQSAPLKTVPSAQFRYTPSGLRIFTGFESARYQEHDEAFIEAAAYWADIMTSRFGAVRWKDGDGKEHPLDLVTADQLKALALVESGGDSERSRKAWDFDPAQSRRDNAYTEISQGRGMPPSQGAFYTEVLPLPAIPRDAPDRNARLSIYRAARVLYEKAFVVSFDRRTGARFVTETRPIADQDSRTRDAMDLYNGNGDPNHRAKFDSLFFPALADAQSMTMAK